LRRSLATGRNYPIVGFLQFLNQPVFVAFQFFPLLPLLPSVKKEEFLQKAAKTAKRQMQPTILLTPTKWSRSSAVMR
jgi:hypothetical protein